ncbi:hypothetical protein ACH5RR_030500 [Cinchona calisaya]|uniref:GCK domain-containing protein n=1 Tax=Cinchona calisaya TaxID=153742 RepID=A0ABD2YW55_9GENT
MGVTLSTTAAARATSVNSSPTSPLTHDSKLGSEPTHDHRPKAPETEDAAEKSSSEDIEVEEEEAICGFGLIRKDERFKDIVVEELEKCIEECEENPKREEEVIKCFNITTMLKRCIKAHPDYLVPLLQAEKAARKEEEKEKKVVSEKGVDRIHPAEDSAAPAPVVAAQGSDD